MPNERSRLIAEKIFKALTEQGAANRETRRPVPLHQLCSIAGATEAEVVAVIETFRREGRSFLMPPVGTPLEPNTIIDISHESLIRNWERLHEWVIEEARSAQIYRRLAEAAVLYHRKEEGLLSGPFLQIALEWREKQRPNRVWAYRYNPEFETADRFLNASRDDRDAKLAAQERELQEKRDSESRELKQAAALAEIEKRLAEAEMQRTEEQALARQRELEHAQAFAEQQARTAGRLKRLTFALIIISLLALGAAGGAVYAYAEARKSEQQAKESERKATRANVDATISLAARTEATIEAEKQRELAQEEKKRAEQQATKAEEAKRDAQVAQSRAEQAAQDALSAAAREAKAAQLARDAETAALENAKKLQTATDRNRWSRDGLAAFQRGDYEEALNAFDIVRDNTRLEADSSGKIVDAETARIDGWTLANIGATQREMGNATKAVESYQEALKILEDTLDPDDPVRFDTYNGLARAYRNASQVDKAEHFYKQALEFLKTNRANKQSRVADGLQNLARLYRDLGRFDEAARDYNIILKIREKEKSGSPEFVATLKEVAQFYVAQNKYKEAEGLYPKILDIQEALFIEEDFTIDVDTESEAAIHSVADSYSDLGEIYIGLNDEQKATQAFQLSRALQDYWAKARQVVRRLVAGSQISSEEFPVKEFFEKIKSLDIDKDLIKVTESLVALERFKTAKGFYLITLETQKDLQELGEDQNQIRSFAQTHKNLGDLYQIYLKDYGKAEQSYQAAVELLVKRDELKSDLALVFEHQGRLYAKQLNKPVRAEELYKQALGLSGIGFRQQDRILSQLAELYREQNRTLELEDILIRRVTATGNMVASWAASGDRLRGKEISTDESALLYLEAVNNLAGFYETRQSKPDAAAVYLQIFTRITGVLENVVDPVILGAYAATLEKYLALLRDLNKLGEVAKVERVVVAVRARQNELERIRTLQEEDLIRKARQVVTSDL